MFFRAKSGMLGCVLLVVSLLLVACDSTGDQQAAATPVSTPQVVTSTAVNSSPGQGVVPVANATIIPGKPNSEKVVLSDRILLINSVSRQQGANQKATFINMDLAVENTGQRVIENLSTFFRLVRPEGDAFGYQYNSSDSFYGPIAAHTTRSGTIMFQLPPAATSNLRLLYRPEIAAETVIILLKVS
jgi:hypothetical protein